MVSGSDKAPAAAADAADLGDLTAPLLALLDGLTGVMFSVKDADGRYLMVNDAFVARSGQRDRRAVLGRRARDLFPAALAARYERQDVVVLAGRPLRDQLEVIRRPGGSSGWYATSKVPLPGGRGVVSVSRDLETPADATGSAVASVGRVVAHVQAALDDEADRRADLSVTALAAVAGCSPAQLSRRTRRVLGLSPAQYVLRSRVDRAVALLAGGDAPLADVALRCGFSDQAALTRTVARLTGRTPGQVRAAARG